MTTNVYYNVGTVFEPGTKAESDAVNAEYAAIAAGFDKLSSSVEAALKERQSYGSEAQGATVNEYLVTMIDARTANQEGDLVAFKATHNNTGPIVINVDNLGNINGIGPLGSALVEGDILTDLIYEFRFNGAEYQMVSLNSAYLGDATQLVDRVTTNVPRLSAEAGELFHKSDSADAPSAGNLHTNLIKLDNDNDETLGQFGFDNLAQMEVSNFNAGESTFFRVTPSSGGATVLLTLNADSGSFFTNRTGSVIENVFITANHANGSIKKIVSFAMLESQETIITELDAPKFSYFSVSSSNVTFATAYPDVLRDHLRLYDLPAAAVFPRTITLTTSAPTGVLTSRVQGCNFRAVNRNATHSLTITGSGITIIAEDGTSGTTVVLGQNESAEFTMVDVGVYIQKGLVKVT
jgi:hypothetical protein